MAKKTGGKKGKGKGGRKYTAADLSFDFGFNVTNKSKKGGKKKPAGGGSV